MYLPYAFRPDLNMDVGEIHIRSNDEVQKFEFSGNSYVCQVNAFLDSIRSNTPLLYTQQQMLQHTRILQKAVEQSATS